MQGPRGETTWYGEGPAETWLPLFLERAAKPSELIPWRVARERSLATTVVTRGKVSVGSVGTLLEGRANP